MLGVQMRRPSLYDLTAEMARIDVPTLIMAGDEDEPCLEAALLMKRTIPTAALAVLPRSGHAINLEEPALSTSSSRFFTWSRPRRAARPALARLRDPRLQEMILLTGGAGFVGLNVAEQLLGSGDEVLIFDLRAPPAVLFQGAFLSRATSPDRSALEQVFSKHESSA